MYVPERPLEPDYEEYTVRPMKCPYCGSIISDNDDIFVRDKEIIGCSECIKQDFYAEYIWETEILGWE